eukprot:scaffold37580_cov67-Phaeocystis_antarctica.AAC.2
MRYRTRLSHATQFRDAGTLKPRGPARRRRAMPDRGERPAPPSSVAHRIVHESAEHGVSVRTLC